MPSTILDVIDLRSFSSIWYWLVVGALWARAINTPLAVPLDILRSAVAGDAVASRDVDDICGMQVRRRAAVSAFLGSMQIALWAFVLTVLAISGIGYGVEISQAVLLLAAPMALVSMMTGRLARRLSLDPEKNDERHKSLLRLKNKIQALGLVSVFVSAIWGMYFNLAMSTF